MKKINIIIFFFTFTLIGCNLNLIPSFGLVKSEPIKNWEIGNYKIIYAKKLGPAGGPYYEYDVYKNGNYLSYNVQVINNDTCNLRFKEKNNYYVDFNICSLSKKIIIPDKEKLTYNLIDSITICPLDSILLIRTGNKYPKPYYDTIISRNFDSTLYKKLTNREMKKFVKRWNSSKANGFYSINKINLNYIIKIYSKGYIRKIKTFNYFMIENTNWSYETKKDEFLNNLWEKD